LQAPAVEGQKLRARQRDWLTAVTASTVLVMCGDLAAHGQTEDYFATPWVVAPSLPQAGAGTTNTATSTTPKPTSQGSRSNLYSQSLASSAPSAPPVLYTFNVGIDEIATDNVAETQSNHVSDVTSLFSAGTTITADTERFSGVLSATGFYQREINETALDQFSEFGYASGQATVVPGNLYMSVNGAIDNLSTLGGGIQSPLVQSNQNTHTYTIGGSPYFVTRVGDFGMNVLRYQIGQAWFSNYAPPPLFPIASSGGLAASTDQSVREDFRTAGTIMPRLMSDLSLSGMENDAGNSASGDLQVANGELINEYEVTRSASLIGGAGYESLRDPEVPVVDGQGAIWDFGARLRPNPDSYALIIYGRHDRKSDFAGEIAWRLTPYTDFYASYTDALNTVQQSIIVNNAGSVLGPAGAVTGVNFDQSTVIGVLDDQALNSTPGYDSSLVPIGIPLGTSNNYSPLQNGLFRTKILSGSARSIFDGDPIALTAYDAQQISLTPFFVSSSSSEGGDLSWSPMFSPSLTGLALVGYAHETGVEVGDVYNAAVGATYLISESLGLDLRYDFIRRQGQSGSGSYIQNAITVGLHKSFN
jgi:hypothetical protein